MNQFLEWVRQLFSSWKFWIVIAPWETGVRVRMGKVAVPLKPGPHFRIPFVDVVTLVNTRLRLETTGTITLKGSAEGKVRVVTATIGFRVVDPVAAMMFFTYPNQAVVSYTQAELSKGLNGNALPALQNKFEHTGISIEFVSLVEEVEVKAYRFLMANPTSFYGHPADEPPTQF